MPITRQGVEPVIRERNSSREDDRPIVLRAVGIGAHDRVNGKLPGRENQRSFHDGLM
jgi:hypothetical protein